MESNVSSHQLDDKEWNEVAVADLKTQLRELYDDCVIEQRVFYRMSQRSKDEGSAAALYNISMRLQRLLTTAYAHLTKLNTRQ